MTLYCHPMAARRTRLAVAMYMTGLATCSSDALATQAWFAELLDRVLARAAVSGTSEGGS